MRATEAKMHPRLVEEFQRIARDRKKALRMRVIRIVLPSSVIRVFRPDTKADLIRELMAIDIDRIVKIGDISEFNEWFYFNLGKVAHAIRYKNRDNPRVNPGYKWGHAAKILTLFIRDLIHFSCYFDKLTAGRVSQWLFVPVDSIVIKRLQCLGCHPAVRSIKEIDSKKKFMEIQNLLADAAYQAGVPRVWFDDNWGDRQ